MDEYQTKAETPSTEPATSALAKTEGLPAVYSYACGDFKAGMLLWRLAYLCRKSKLVRGDVKWYVRSRAELMADLGWSKGVYDRAIRILRQKEIIETSNAAKLHYPHASMQTSAFSITKKGHEAIAKGRSIVLNSYKK